jgi:hypothetical protein
MWQTGHQLESGTNTYHTAVCIYSIQQHAPARHGATKLAKMRHGMRTVRCARAVALLTLLASAPAGALRRLHSGSATVVAACPSHLDDCTAPLLAALLAPGATMVIIPSAPRAVWPVLPMEMTAAASNRRVVFEPGLTIEAKRGAFRGGADSLLTCTGLENVTVEGAGARFLMHRADYANASAYTPSESRMGMQIMGCKNISVHGINISSTVRAH